MGDVTSRVSRRRGGLPGRVWVLAAAMALAGCGGDGGEASYDDADCVFDSTVMSLPALGVTTDASGKKTYRAPGTTMWITREPDIVVKVRFDGAYAGTKALRRKGMAFKQRCGRDVNFAVRRSDLPGPPESMVGRPFRIVLWGEEVDTFGAVAGFNAIRFEPLDEKP